MLPRMYTEKPEGKYDYDRQKKMPFILQSPTLSP